MDKKEKGKESEQKLEAGVGRVSGEEEFRGMRDRGKHVTPSSEAVENVGGS